MNFHNQPRENNMLLKVWLVLLSVIVVIQALPDKFGGVTEKLLDVAGVAANHSLAINDFSANAFISYEDEDKARVVTISEIEAAMEEVGELTTVTYDYEGYIYESDCEKLFGYELSLTRNSLEIEYEGTIRAGYNVSDITYEVDDEARIIYVTLPRAQVFSNEITDTNIEYVDGFFNSVDADLATNLIEEAKDGELDMAVDYGLYNQAEVNAQNVISEALAAFDGYKVEFAAPNDNNAVDTNAQIEEV